MKKTALSLYKNLPNKPSLDFSLSAHDALQSPIQLQITTSAVCVIAGFKFLKSVFPPAAERVGWRMLFLLFFLQTFSGGNCVDAADDPATALPFPSTAFENLTWLSNRELTKTVYNVASLEACAAICLQETSYCSGYTWHGEQGWKLLSCSHGRQLSQ